MKIVKINRNERGNVVIEMDDKMLSKISFWALMERGEWLDKMFIHDDSYEIYESIYNDFVKVYDRIESFENTNK
jgi:hypothetical protein